MFERDAIHAISPIGGSEHSLCGLAFDAFESGDLEYKPIFAKSGDKITCAMCRAIIDYCKAFKDYYKQP